MNRIGGDYRTRSQQVHAEALSKFAQLVNDGLASEDQLVTDARAEMSTAVARIAAEYDTLKAEAESRSAAGEEVPATRIHCGLWSDFWDGVGNVINSVRRWFADTFGEFLGGLLFGILAGLIMVAIGLRIGWVVGAIVAALKLAAIVAVIILVVVAVGLNIYNRFQEFYADHPGEDAGFSRGLGLVGLGIADLTGIPFIVEGIVGQRPFSPHPMTDFERGERLGMGLVFFGAAIVSVRAMLRNRAAPPGERTPSGKLRPPSPPQEMARTMGWGNGPEGIPPTRARIGTLTREELVRGGGTRQLAEQWREFYREAARDNPYDPSTGRGNPQAQPRSELMQRAVELLTEPVVVPVQPPRGGDSDGQGGSVQPKLSVGQPDDPAEPEADEWADSVVDDPNAAVQREAAQEEEERPEETVQPLLIQRQAAEEEPPEEEEQAQASFLQRKPAGGSSSEIGRA